MRIGNEEVDAQGTQFNINQKNTTPNGPENVLFVVRGQVFWAIVVAVANGCECVYLVVNRLLFCLLCVYGRKT